MKDNEMPNQKHTPNKRKGGSGLPHYLMMELRQALDPNCPSRPSRRRLGASVLLEDSQVMSAPRRPSCAPRMNENQLRSLPLGVQGNFPLAQRCLQLQVGQRQKGTHFYSSLHAQKAESAHRARRKKKEYE